MKRENGVDLFWSTLFNYNLGIKEIIIEQIKGRPPGNYSAIGLTALLGSYDDDRNDENYTKACEIAALRFCLEGTDIASELLSKEDYEKAVQLFERKNYASKLLKDLLAKFVSLVHTCRIESCKGHDGDEKIKLV